MKNFVFKKEWREALKDYSAEVRAEVYEAILAYAFEGEIIEMSDLSKMAFNFIKLSIDAMQDAYKKKCEKNRQNITRRWNENTEVCESVPNDTKVYDSIPNDTEVCETIPNDTLYKSNQINTNQINSNQCVSEKNAHAPTPTHEEEKFKQFNEWCKVHAPLSLAFTEPLTLEHFVWLYRKYGGERMKNCASDLHNKEAYKTNRNAMNVWKRWIEKVQLPANVYRRA